MAQRDTNGAQNETKRNAFGVRIASKETHSRPCSGKLGEIGSFAPGAVTSRFLPIGYLNARARIAGACDTAPPSNFLPTKGKAASVVRRLQARFISPLSGCALAVPFGSSLSAYNAGSEIMRTAWRKYVTSG